MTAAASIAWLIISGVGLYLWGLVTAPAQIAAEKQEKIETLERQEANSERARRRRMIDKLYDLYVITHSDLKSAPDGRIGVAADGMA